MKDLIEYIAKSIVTQPDAVSVNELSSDDGITIKLQVADDDRGRIIGKQGKVAQSMRMLLRVMAVKQGARVHLQIL